MLSFSLREYNFLLKANLFAHVFFWNCSACFIHTTAESKGTQPNIKVMFPLIKQFLPLHGLSTKDISHVTLFLSWGLVHSPSCLLYPTNHLLSMQFALNFSCGIICAIQWYQVPKFCLHYHVIVQHLNFTIMHKTFFFLSLCVLYQNQRGPNRKEFNRVPHGPLSFNIHWAHNQCWRKY